MATLSTLVGRLKDYARIGDQEGIIDSQLSRILTDCLYRHDSTLVGDFSRLPVSHEEALLTLAWASICYIRASKFAPEPSLNVSKMTTAAFGQDRDTPFRKALDMAKQLEARYKEMIGLLGHTPPATDQGASGSIVLGELSVKEHYTGLHTATPADQMVGPFLKVGEKTATTVVLTWNKSLDSRFDEYQVFQQLTPGIYQAWNFNSGSGYAHLSNAAQKLISLNDRAQTAVRVEGLTTGQEYYFLVTARTTSGQVGYSNEVAVTLQ